MIDNRKSGRVDLSKAIRPTGETKTTIRAFLIDPEKEEEPPGVTITTPTEVIVSSKSINMPVFHIKPAENSVPRDSKGDPFLDPTQASDQATESESSQETVEEASETDPGE